jgi:hypothetical protein
MASYKPIMMMARLRLDGYYMAAFSAKGKRVALTGTGATDV